MGHAAGDNTRWRLCTISPSLYYYATTSISPSRERKGVREANDQTGGHTDRHAGKHNTVIHTTIYTHIYIYAGKHIGKQVGIHSDKHRVI